MPISWFPSEWCRRTFPDAEMQPEQGLDGSAHPFLDGDDVPKSDGSISRSESGTGYSDRELIEIQQLHTSVSDSKPERRSPSRSLSNPRVTGGGGSGHRHKENGLIWR